MKKYLFFCCGVFGIGGGQLYISNKTEYLVDRGYSVITVSTSSANRKAKIRYNGLNRATNIINTNMQFHPDAYPCRRQKLIIKKIIKSFCLQPDDEVYIESNSILHSSWAEKVAEQIGAKHIIFTVSEYNHVDNYLCDFLEFKFSRGELATIKHTTITELFEKSKIITPDNIKVLRAVLGDNVDEIESEKLNQVVLSDHNICIIGRGEKRYVSFACESLADFCSKHPEDTFTIGLVTVLRDKALEKQIIGRLTKLKNVKVYLLGYLSPIPKKLFRMFDLFIGGAGCASLPYRQKALTLAMDVHKDAPLGLMGYDTDKTLITSEDSISMSEKLEDAIYTKQYLKKTYMSPITLDIENAFVPHMQFIEESSEKKAYYSKKDCSISFKEKIKARFPFLISIYRFVWRNGNGKQKRIQ